MTCRLAPNVRQAIACGVELGGITRVLWLVFQDLEDRLGVPGKHIENMEEEFNRNMKESAEASGL